MPNRESTCLQKSAAKFLVHIRENCRVSQVAIDSVIKGVDELLDSYLNIAIVRFFEFTCNILILKIHR